ncbi:MAG: tetratricopeptide repeat protein [Candidatus Cloacimonas sp.]|jgi:TolA-binding protein|nr:tetratricopeptide repeat protein [Candidatus Cloacimonas sp.]
MKRYLIVLSVLLLTGLMACGLNNTMYNARNYYKAAQERPLNTNGKPNAQAIDEYTKAIKKCGIIISERKNSALLDDAVFLMAKSLYFKGNSAFQAKDQFQNLLLSFPKSPFVAESQIYIAKILREINQPREAEKLLEEFIRNPQFRKDHPKALLILTDFAIKDKDFVRAQYWLERIISDYPKTKEFREAYFLFGKNYYEQQDFTRSLNAFQKMQGARGIDKGLKLDASYYIALNQLELGDLDKANRNVKGLLKVESRPEKIPMVRVLKARVLFARADSTDAISEVGYITKTYPRTESAAAAFYYLGEYYYYKAGDHAKAVTNYNRVRTEFSTSLLATIGQNKATAVGYVSPKANLNSETGLTAFLDHYYQGAESFLSHLALPDSAIAYYEIVIHQKDVLVARRDSLQIGAGSITSSLDSLAVKLESVTADSLQSYTLPVDSSKVDLEILASDSLAVQMETEIQEVDSLAVDLETVVPQADSLAVELETEVQEVDSLAVELETEVQEADSLAVDLETEVSKADSLPVELETEVPQADSIAVELETEIQEVDSLAVDLETEIPQADSLKQEISTSVADSLAAVAVSERQRKSLLETELSALNARIKTLSELIARFETDIVPFCLFAIGSVVHDYYPQSSRNAEVLAQMQTSYADNKFSKALSALQNGQTVRLIDPAEELQEVKLDALFGQITAEPDSALAGLQELLNSDYPHIQLAANYRLAWYYSFEQIDTLAAAAYLKAVLDNPQAGDYGIITRRFYDGKKFLLRGAIPSPSIDSLAVPSDSLNNPIADSLAAFKGIPAFMDSLAAGIPPSLAIPDSLRKYLPAFSGLEDSPKTTPELSPLPDVIPETPELIPAEPENPVAPPEKLDEEFQLE